MKVKEPLNILNKKKNALPSSKLLKPKKFKQSLKKSAEEIKTTLSKGKLKLLNENIGEKVEYRPNGKPMFARSSKKIKAKNSLVDVNDLTPHSNRKVKGTTSITESKINKVSKLFDFVTSDEKKGRPTDGDMISPIKKHNTVKNLEEKQLLENMMHSNKKKEKILNDGVRPKKSHVLNSQKSDLRSQTKHKEFLISSQKLLLMNAEKGQSKENDATSFNKCKLKESKVAAVTQGLLKLIEESSASKPEIFDLGEPVFLQVECIKIPICPTKQLRIKLPHPTVDETSDVLLITADLKGHKIYPDKAVEHYEELLAKLDIKFINKVMPLRMVKKEYSQYELKRKLVDQFDMILADSRIIKSLATVLGKFALYKRKMPVPVNLMIGEHKLKKHLKDAICKTQMTVKSNGHCSIVQIGHTKMKAKEIAANIVEVAKSLETMYPGGWRNVRSLVIKTAKSTALPVYLSLLSPNEVNIPVEVRRKPEPLEGELSTMPGHNVIVTADGNVILKKVVEDLKIDDSKDDEILEEAKKYLESSKTVRYDESSDEEKKDEKEGSDSDDEGEAITEAMEKKLMSKYEKNAKAKSKKEDANNDDEEEGEEEEEEEEDNEEESEVLIGKKRKSEKTKRQKGPPAKKSLQSAVLKGKNKVDKSSKDSKSKSSPGFKKPQLRGTRGGKKNKLSKDQRKALIKRKKAGKK